MGIFKALGIGLFLLIISSIMPLVFVELQRTLIVLLQSSSQAFAAAGSLASEAGRIVP